MNFLRRQIETGRSQQASPKQMKVRWIRVGPFMGEFHHRVKIGLTIDFWYVAIDLGPLCFSFGKRKWIAGSPFPWEWSTTSSSSSTVTVDWKEA